ncbi:MAG: Delta(1)-pyrroline-2-carboxylate reductase [Gemmatimonadetes bacterium]|nr:Delta(1)-pyrroline-2-carboxylate reductase [Gemmatimonadota bacterium]
MRIITEAEVPGLLPMDECMDVMASALATLARGGAILPLRPLMRIPQKAGILGMMPAYMDTPDAMGVKVITVFNGNHGTEYDSHQGVVLLFEADHGSIVAVIDASSVTAIRTAAVSGVATRLLARTDASDLCILGSGVQARTHLEAMLVARPVTRVRVWSRNASSARDFARVESKRHGIVVEAIESAQQAVDGADIICTTTSSREPVLEGEWITPGAHINAVGSSTPTARELDSAAVARAKLFVDRRESTLNEAGDFLIPKSEGLIGDGHIRAELGEILLGTQKGRESDDEITLFKSLGLAVEDVAAAHHIYARAVERGVGTSVEMGGKRSTT